MNNLNLRLLRLFVLGLLLPQLAAAADPAIPAPLQEWKDWALWDAPAQVGPQPFDNGSTRLHAWPSELSLVAEAQGGRFSLQVAVYAETWIALPGNQELWPQGVQVDGKPVAVLSRKGTPSVRLAPGTRKITGAFQWPEMPQRIAVPPSIGLLSLAVAGGNVRIPDRDADGQVWLKRMKAEETDRDSITAQVYRLIEDGLPIWLRTEVELSVTGRSREEDLGSALPEGWKLASVEAPIPVAVSEDGSMKAQVRAGKWKIRLNAFTTEPTPEFRFAENRRPITATELVALKPAPQLRVAEVEGLPPVDVSQTTFPGPWRAWQVYAWKTGEVFRLVERMRGMGAKRPAGLQISQEMWLDGDGLNLTWQDQISGTAQQTWRLDVAPGRDLGAVKIDGDNQLITHSPAGASAGVEVRRRNLNMTAVGRAPVSDALPATGWQADADSLTATLHLPPGWRAFAVFGAEWVDGDWLTAWTLLDLFFLLVFSMAVGRVWGWRAGMVAFTGFVLAYHEPGAPRFTWVFLLIPILLLRVVPPGRIQRALKWWTRLAIVLLILVLTPFVTGQIQSALYPQLEQERPLQFRSRVIGAMAEASRYSDSVHAPAAKQDTGTVLKSNLLYDAQARIQTGPAVPEWSWRTIRFGWNGPVSASQSFRPILLSPVIERLLIVARIVLLLLLPWILLRRWLTPPPLPPAKSAAVVLLALLAVTSQGWAAETPDAETLTLLRNRLLEADDAFPQAAEIPRASLVLQDGRIILEAEVHAAALVGVPMPGKLANWAPQGLTVDGRPARGVMRRAGFLWVAVDAGVHQVRVEGLLPEAPEWELTFLLKPRMLAIDAPGWTVTGLRPGDIPEDQVFFARERPAAALEAAYDRKDYQAIVEVRRHLELGLVWQVHTEVRRLSDTGKAIALSLPLLPGERVLTASHTPAEGRLEVRLGATEESVSWDSELEVRDSIALAAEKTNRWVESWHLVVSPVWNVAISGIEPVFEPEANDLIPVWHPWPGESVTLSITRPEAVAGETLTIRRIDLKNDLGTEHRAGILQLTAQASLGHDFAITLPPDAEITALALDDRPVPVRKKGERVLVPIRPGEQSLSLSWQTPRPLGWRTSMDAVELPVASSNVTTRLQLPQDRWVLWTDGPVRGPAVRFWPVLITALLFAFLLGRLPLSPLRRWEWVLLSLGLTQVALPAALFLVGWLFLLSWRGTLQPASVGQVGFDLLQVFLVLAALPVAIILLAILHRGLLGYPEMFILGNGSSQTQLTWFEPRSGSGLPTPGFISVSVWWYRGLMLAWALWLASSFLRWAPWGWRQFSSGGLWRKAPPKATGSAPAPTKPEL